MEARLCVEIPLILGTLIGLLQDIHPSAHPLPARNVRPCVPFLFFLSTSVPSTQMRTKVSCRCYQIAPSFWFCLPARPKKKTRRCDYCRIHRAALHKPHSRACMVSAETHARAVSSVRMRCMEDVHGERVDRRDRACEIMRVRSAMPGCACVGSCGGGWPSETEQAGSASSPDIHTPRSHEMKRRTLQRQSPGHAACLWFRTCRTPVRIRLPTASDNAV